MFLSASTPGDKYKVRSFLYLAIIDLHPTQFFLLGTQLHQLSLQYDQCLENIRKTSKVLAQKHQAIPDLKAKFQAARARFAEAQLALEQKKKVDDLKKELAWSHVAGKKREMEAKAVDVEKILHTVRKLEGKLAAAQVLIHVSWIRANG